MAFSLLGCPHTHLSFPMLIRNDATGAGAAGHLDATAAVAAPAAMVPMAHVTCLDCGREFWYDWAHMRRLGARPQPVYAPAPGSPAGGRRAA